MCVCVGGGGEVVLIFDGQKILIHRPFAIQNFICPLRSLGSKTIFARDEMDSKNLLYTNSIA